MEEAISIATPRGVLRGIRHRADGFSAVLLQGYFSSTHIGAARFYVQLGRALARRGVELWRVDPYGVGNSDGDFSDTTFDSELDDYARVIEAARPRLLIGHSLGATLALLLPAEHTWLVAPSFGRFPPALLDEGMRAELAGGSTERKATVLRADFVARIEEPIVHTRECVVFRGSVDEHYGRDSLAAVPYARVVEIDGGDHNFLVRGTRELLWRAMESELLRL